MDKTKKIGLIIFVVVVIISAIIVYFAVQTKDNLNQLAMMNIEEIDLSETENGLYTGTYTVFPITVVVSIEVVDHKMIDIEILKHTQGQGIAAEVIIDDVLDNQSINVDAIAGATYSSKVILLAIKAALTT